MSVIVKRSGKLLPQECPYGCCTEVYGENLRNIRHSLKRREERNWRKEYECVTRLAFSTRMK